MNVTAKRPRKLKASNLYRLAVYDSDAHQQWGQPQPEQQKHLARDL